MSEIKGKRKRIVKNDGKETGRKSGSKKDVVIVIDAIQLREKLLPVVEEMKKLGRNTQICEITLGENFFRFVESLGDKVTKVVYFSVHDKEQRTEPLTFRRGRKVKILHFKGKFNKTSSPEKIDKFLSKN